MAGFIDIHTHAFPDPIANVALPTHLPFLKTWLSI